jgi:hypothetical protein
VSIQEFSRDIEIEFKSKILYRLESVQPVIEYFKKWNIQNVNGYYVSNLTHTDIIETIFSRLEKWINVCCCNTSGYEYNIIHGDCQFSNTIISGDGNIRFIDPRGYFGKTMFYGSAYYDYSKVIYALTGYDAFNAAENYFFNEENHNIELNIKDEINQYASIFAEKGINLDICICMAIVHWLGLASYCSNNVLKCIAAYYNAFYLFKKYVH